MLDTQTRIKKLQLEYAEAVQLAEKDIKFADNTVSFEIIQNKLVVSGLCIPAINELRCSAFHVSQAFLEKDSNKVIDLYNKAINHCKRASYEALDIVIHYIINNCKEFQKDYKLVQIEDIPANYQEDCLYLNTIKKNFPSKSECSAEEYCNKIREIVTKAGAIYEKWETSRLELNKKITKAVFKLIIEIVVASCTVITAIGTVVGLVLQYYFR